jgi:hypothetical protein
VSTTAEAAPPRRRYRRSVRRVTIREPFEWVHRSITVEREADRKIREIADARGATYSGTVGEAIEAYVAAQS